MNVVPNDPKIEKDGQTLVDRIEVNATSMPKTDFSQICSDLSLKVVPPAIYGFGETNVNQNDPKTRKRAQPLVDAIELNATSKVSSRENERQSK